MIKINKEDYQDFPKRGNHTQAERGFQLELSNGYVVSVQWGYGNYANHRWDRVVEGDRMRSPNAEVGVMRKRRCGAFMRSHQYDFIESYGCGGVDGWQNADEVAKVITAMVNKTRKGAFERLCDGDISLLDYISKGDE